MSKKLEESMERIRAAMEAREKENLQDSYRKKESSSEGSKGQKKGQIPSRVVELPVKWSEEERAIPNAVARSALFAPIKRGQRALHEKTLIASRGDVTIYHTGRQLDMADQDVWLLLIEIARRRPLGEYIEVSRYEILKAVGRHVSNTGYAWLHSSIERLKTSTVWFKTKKFQAALTMVDYFELDEETGKYYLRMGPELVKFYDRKEYALINWANRYAIQKHVDLAKWLQAYIASHKHGEEHRIGLEKLKEWSGAKSQIWDFKQDLLTALAELERLGEIEKPRIEADMVVWERY